MAKNNFALDELTLSVWQDYFWFSHSNIVYKNSHLNEYNLRSPLKTGVLGVFSKKVFQNFALKSSRGFNCEA